MTIFTKSVSLFAMMIAGVLASTTSRAQSYRVTSTPATVKFIENGWYGEQLRFKLGVSILTPCAGGTMDDYAISAAHPAYKELVNMVLTSYFTGKKLVATVSATTCPLGRADILSVTLDSTY